MKTLKFKPYFIEPLRSMRKISTIRKSDKGLKKEDIVECVFEGTNFSIFRIHYKYFLNCKHLCLHFSEEPVGNHVRARTYVRIRT